MSAGDTRSAMRPDPGPGAGRHRRLRRRSRHRQREPRYETARYCLMDTLACAFQALDYPACTKLLGPVVPGATLPGGARVPGTHWELDPVQAAFNIGAMIRWLDFNDTWLAAEWGHPSDNLGAILAVADYLVAQEQRRRRRAADACATCSTAMIKAHEIQGVLALENSFNRVGLDHVLLVRIASTAVATHMLGGTREQVVNALSNAWIDGGALRTYRHAPNTGSRKSWAAGDAYQPRRAPRADGAHRGDGLSLGPDGAAVGLPATCCSSGNPVTLVAPATAATSWRTCCSRSRFPGRVPRPDRGRGGAGAASRGARPARRHRTGGDRDPGVGRAHHRQDRSAGQPGRPRPLHPVHDRRAADLRPPDRD